MRQCTIRFNQTIDHDEFSGLESQWVNSGQSWAHRYRLALVFPIPSRKQFLPSLTTCVYLADSTSLSSKTLNGAGARGGAFWIFPKQAYLARPLPESRRYMSISDAHLPTSIAVVGFAYGIGYFIR